NQECGLATTDDRRLNGRSGPAGDNDAIGARGKIRHGEGPIGGESKVDGTSFLVIDLGVGRLFPFGGERVLLFRRKLRPIWRAPHLVEGLGPDAAVKVRRLIGIDEY